MTQADASNKKYSRGADIYRSGAVSIACLLCIRLHYLPAGPRERNIFNELGEGFGEVGLWALLFIYARTLLKLVTGKGPIARRLLPDYTPALTAPGMQQLLGLLDRTHVYVGIAAVAVILVHIGLMGLPMHILFFPALLALVIWQGLFGMFLTWRYTPKELKKLAYLVHAQFFTGIMIGVFAWLGHLLVGD